MYEIRTLRAEEIEVKIKQVTEKGALALLYKTARTDMAILDETFGPSSWTNDYKEIKGNMYCGIAVFMLDIKDWVWRWDCGIESRADDEGNEKKGEASDAFKRAGTRWGIGRELYTAPFIFLRVPVVQEGKDARGRPRYTLKDRFARFSVKSIEYDEARRISVLEIVDQDGVVVFTYPKQGAKSPAGAVKADGPRNEPRDAATPQRAAKAAAKPAQTKQDKTLQAFNREILVKGTARKLGDMPAQWLRDMAEKAQDPSLKEDMLLVAAEKFKEEMRQSEEAAPFDDDPFADGKEPEEEDDLFNTEGLPF